MNILVTGHKGFVGKNMVPFLHEKGHTVFTYEWGDTLPNYFYKLDWVIHLGAISSTAETDATKITDQNILSSIWFIDRCVENGVNIQFASSASVYGDSDSFSEDSKAQPKSLYALSKYIVEKYALAKKEQGARNIIQAFRYFNVYGPHEDYKENQASPFYKFEKESENYDYVTLFEGSDQYKRDFVHVSQVINTHVEFFNVKESGVWNIGTGRTLSFEDVARVYTTNFKYIPIPDSLKNGYQKYTCADTTKLTNTLRKLS